MRLLTLSAPGHSRAVLQQEINRHQDARDEHRRHCVWLVASGLSCEQTAGLFGDSPRTLVNWGRRFDRQGLAGLAEGNHSGRPDRLSAEQLEAVRGWVRQPPAAAAVDANLWDGKSLAACLQKRYGVQLSGAPVPTPVPLGGYAVSVTPPAGRQRRPPTAGRA